MRWDVARAAGIAVVVPGAADAVALLNEQKRIHSGFTEFDGHAESGEPGTDDEHFDSDFFRLSALLRVFAHRVSHATLNAPAATSLWRNSALSRRDWRASGMRCGASCQACGTTGHTFNSTRTRADRARSARRVESSRRTSSAPT